MTSPLPPWETLSLTEQIAQMVVVRTSGHLFDHQRQYPAWEANAEQLQRWLGQTGVGGVILLGGSAAEVALRTQQLQEWARVPLLLAADIEEGVGQRFAGATWFPPPMALGAIAQANLPQALTYAERMGAVTAQEAIAIGLNWVLAPVVDVNNNPANPVINVRAFGETPELVSQLTTAFLQGAQQHPVLTAAKHFPGHGDTATDSHLELPLITHDRQRLEAMELPPFRAAIAQGVDAVMTAHLQIPALDADYPATFSAPTLTQLLRRDLGFQGLVVTDAMIMGAITRQYGTDEAAILAVEAGADILLMPADPDVAIAAVAHAVERGRIAPERIHASLERIWQAKHKVYDPGVEPSSTTHAWEAVPPPPINLAQLAQPEAMAVADHILQDAMQVRVPQPLGITSSARNLILVDDMLACPFLRPNSPAIALPQSLGYRLQLIDNHSAAAPLDINSEIPRPTLLQIFIRGNPFRGSAGMTKSAQDWFQTLLRANDLQALVIYGSPYVLDAFVTNLPQAIPYVFTYGQMPAAQAIALQALFEPAQPSSDRPGQFTT